jgi:hypothetical protein
METLEDAAKNKYPIENTGAMFMPNRHDVNKIYRQEGFIAGAQWQQERMYSAEDMEEAFTNGLNRSFDSDFDRWLEQFKKK